MYIYITPNHHITFHISARQDDANGEPAKPKATPAKAWRKHFVLLGVVVYSFCF